MTDYSAGTAPPHRRRDVPRDAYILVFALLLAAIGWGVWATWFHGGNSAAVSTGASGGSQTGGQTAATSAQGSLRGARALVLPGSRHSYTVAVPACNPSAGTAGATANVGGTSGNSQLNGAGPGSLSGATVLTLAPGQSRGVVVPACPGGGGASNGGSNPPAGGANGTGAGGLQPTQAVRVLSTGEAAALPLAGRVRTGTGGGSGAGWSRLESVLVLRPGSTASTIVVPRCRTSGASTGHPREITLGGGGSGATLTAPACPRSGSGS